MHFINIQRFGEGRLLLLLPAPARIIPTEALQTVNNRGGSGPQLGIKRIRVTFEKTPPVRAGYLVFVDRPFPKPGDEESPHPAGIGEKLHPVIFGLPAVKIAADPHHLGVGRPNGKAHAGAFVF
ncbi:hypothetical protein D3C76_1452550 [compost metagenome]